MMTLRRLMRFTPKAIVTVTTATRPSGMTDTCGNVTPIWDVRHADAGRQNTPQG
jgi:hypothetical protein